jgi:hypothetical protein
MNSFIRLKQLRYLTLSLFREIIREPGVLFWGILFPILMSLGLGVAFTKKMDVTRKVAVIDGKEIMQKEGGTGSIYDFLGSRCE